MAYKIEWTFNADISFTEESNFILSKWNVSEVHKFEELVNQNLEKISINPTIGNFKYKNVYSLVISKQTTIYYRVNNQTNTIQIIVFWNNLKNPIELIKLL